jgi:hypothetical protein
MTLHSEEYNLRPLCINRIKNWWIHWAEPMDRIGNTNKAERVVVENPVQRYQLLLSNKWEDDIMKEYRETICSEGRSTELKLFQWWATVLTRLCNFIYIVYEQFLYTWFQAHHIGI